MIMVDLLVLLLTGPKQLIVKQLGRFLRLDDLEAKTSVPKGSPSSRAPLTSYKSVNYGITPNLSEIGV